MARTLVDLLNNTFIRLNEAANSTFGQLEAGGGNTAIQATTATMIGYLNEGQAELARTCLLFPGKGTATLAIGQQVIALQDLSGTMDRSTSPDGTIVWAAADVAFGGTALTFAGREAARLRFNNYYTTASSTPYYWWKEGGNSISVWPAPAFTATITVRGFCIPPQMTAGSTASWFPDDLAQYLEVFAALRIAQLNQDDPSLYVRTDHLIETYNNGRRDMYRKIPSTLAADLQMSEPPALPMPPKPRG